MRYLIFTLLFTLGACAEIKVRSSYAPNTDFSKYKTWCWLKGCDLVYQGPGYVMDSATIEHIANAIAVEMQQKGFVQVDDMSDILVDFHIVVKQDSAISARVHEEDLPFWDLYENNYYHFLRGSLIIDIADRRKGEMVWRSNSRRVMSIQPDIRLSHIQKGVRKALRKFPPKQVVVESNESGE
ncbi:MAG: DUF4136 domain-containing protein [Bacteroidota bacterium]